jgi:hypothetical protein
MALILVDGSVFLHVPKTGGSFVTKALTDLGLVDRAFSKKHADVDRLLNKYRRNYGQTSPFIFCFVRNPLKWYESWWKYNNNSRGWQKWGSSASGDAGWHPQNMLNGCGDPDFPTFVRNVVRRRPGYVTELYGWYDRPETSFVGRNENLVLDLIHVLRSRNLAFDEPKLRAMSAVGVAPGQESITWPSDLRAEVMRLEAAAFARYGYDCLDGEPAPPTTPDLQPALP